MEFNYTIDPNADEPIMLIDRHIGMDDEDGEGIMGDKFCRELMFLDTLNKSRINIWINSPGGTVTDGQQIYNTILKTKTKVDTHNVGMAASIAFPIFMAGCKRFMMDNTTAMTHPVSGGDQKSRAALEKAVNTMLSSRSFITPEKITEMMNRTTWLTAKDCGPEGLNLCEVEYSSEYNKPRKTPDAEGIKASWIEYKSVVNKLIENKKAIKMSELKDINNRLKLNEDAAKSSTIAAIDAIENRAVTAENKLRDQEAQNSAKFEILNKQIETLTTDKTAVENKLKDIETKATNEKKEALKSEAKNFAEDAAKSGKIENKAEAIEALATNYEANPEGTKLLVNSLPSNKKSPGSVVKNQLKPGEGTGVAVDNENPKAYVTVRNAEMQNKAKNRFKGE